jgi:hypothetical protein
MIRKVGIDNECEADKTRREETQEEFRQLDNPSRRHRW